VAPYHVLHNLAKDCYPVTEDCWEHYRCAIRESAYVWRAYRSQAML
jgi:hypothetical protein